MGILVIILLVSCRDASSKYEHTTPTFTNVAKAVGLDFQHGAFRWGMSGDPVAMMGGGVCWLDYDNDGWLDLYVVNSYTDVEAGRWNSETGSLPRNALFRNDDGQFSDVSANSGADVAVRGNGCVAADLNLDGFTDLYVTTSRFNLLLWNNGDGTFSEGGETANVAAYGWQTAATVGDVNADGWPDLFVAGYVNINNQIESATMGFPNTHFGRPDLLYLNQGLDTAGHAIFQEVHNVVGLIEHDPDSEFEYGLGAALTDFDGDGDLDLFVANDTNPNRLYLNQPLADDPEGIGFRFVESGATAQVDDTNSGMGVASGDFDADGRADLFITNMGEQLHSVYRNESGIFSDATPHIGIADIGMGWTGWGTSWADFDLDGDLDLFVANGAIPILDLEVDGMLAQVYENLTAQGDFGRFQDATTTFGLEQVGPRSARGSAVADYDNDGDLDIAINSIGGALTLLQNNGGTGNWLMIAFEHFEAGTHVIATLEDGRQLHRTLTAGSSYLSSEDPRCHFGLAGFDKVAELQIRYPDGREIVRENVGANQILSVP